MLIVDAHQDLAWNMLTFGRNYTRSALETRQLERGSRAVEENDDTVLGWHEYQRGRVALIFATLYATPQRRCTGVWDKLCYADYEQAHRLYSNQLGVYEELADQHPDKFRLVTGRRELDEILQLWKKADIGLSPPPASQIPLETLRNQLAGIQLPPQPPNHNQEETLEPIPGLPVGLVPLMEGAEGVREPAELEWWWQRGVRLIGPAWTGTRYCGGTREPGPLTKDGFALLEEMAQFGFILDLTHMDEAAVLQALDVYPGAIVASHSHAQALLRGASTSNRLLSDRIIQGILERDGVMGIVPFNAFLKHGWRRGDSRAEVTLETIVAQIDYICQMAGDAYHVGIGTDFDGGFGLQCSPNGIDTIADLQKLTPLLADKGYDEIDIAHILGENWIKRLHRVLT